ncbi:hypothetical protein Fot_36453 [Forsythia ovata]|uniref:Ycf15 n=1 Tax=Forsythia ovata TaxID=205694 RepID=A0ABD1SPP9_9LAMI
MSKKRIVFISPPNQFRHISFNLLLQINFGFSPAPNQSPSPNLFWIDEERWKRKQQISERRKSSDTHLEWLKRWHIRAPLPSLDRGNGCYGSRRNCVKGSGTAMFWEFPLCADGEGNDAHGIVVSFTPT